MIAGGRGPDGLRGEAPARDGRRRATAYRTLGPAILVPLLLVSQLAGAQTVVVGDVEVDPRDFAPHQDSRTRIASCLACHGEHGGGDADFGPDVRFGTPALRGLRHGYLVESLVAYRTGDRPHEEMSAIGSMLDDETIDFMARTFSAYPVPPARAAGELEKLASEDARFRRGRAIALQGLPGKEVPACASCHGASGEGIAALGPRLAGQNGLYVQRQLAAYAKRARRGARAALMQPVVAGLSADDVDAVAHYYEQLVQGGGTEP